jgi:hypothetical protein
MFLAANTNLALKAYGQNTIEYSRSFPFDNGGNSESSPK